MLSSVNSNEIKFEDALDRLEKIIESLQSSNLSLEESLSVFEEGVALIRVCQEKLDKADTKISLLLKGENGNTVEVPFNGKTEG